MHLSIGTTLQGGRYLIENVLSQGGFGITYLAHQSGLDRKVAIKEFYMQEYCNRDSGTSYVSVPSVGSRELVERFRLKFIKEARMIASFCNAHIISIHDVFEENGTAYYVMEYLEGKSLASIVKEKGLLAESLAIQYINQVAEALAEVHANKLLHLDIKPANIMLNKKGEAVLIDFGISKHYDESGKQTSSALIGISEGYAPLEQYESGALDSFVPATDIYALGATFFFLLTGQRPPKASEVMNYGLPELPQEISPSVRDAVTAAMQPSVRLRPQSVAEFLKLLENGAKSKDERGKSKDERGKSKDETLLNSSSTPPFEKVGEFSNDINDSEETLANSSSTPRGEVSRSDGGESKLKPENKKSNLPLIIIILLLSVILGAGGYLLFSSGNETENTTPEPPQPKVVVEEKKDEKNDAIVPSVEIKKETTPFYITTTPSGADVYIDGKHIGKTPISGKKIEQGKHTIKIEKEEYNALTKKYTFEATPLVINEVLTEKTKPTPVVDNSFKTRTFTVNGVSFKMVAVEGGSFKMGATSEQQNPDSDEFPLHSVTLDDYYIGETEVTQELWQAVMGTSIQSQAKNGTFSTDLYGVGKDYPMYYISYKDCDTFINKLNTLLASQLPTGRKFAFPTEAQWEYAARGGNKSKGYQYSGSDNLDNVDWYSKNSNKTAHPVKQKQANELGLYDMGGNVYEWCYDWYGGYTSSSQTNPEGPSSGSNRVLRGVCWCDWAQACRVANRNYDKPDNSSSYNGLRLAL